MIWIAYGILILLFIEYLWSEIKYDLTTKCPKCGGPLSPNESLYYPGAFIIGDWKKCINPECDFEISWEREVG